MAVGWVNQSGSARAHAAVGAGAGATAAGRVDQHRFERRLVWSGEGLVLSERTAQNHVQHILTKLGLTNRSQVAVWVNSRKSSMPAE